MPKRAAAFASSSKSTPTSKKRKVGKGSSVKGKSVWNSTDDWDEMVETASLSTASIATRRPRPRGLKSLSACATDAAVRGFKWVWEEGGESGGTNGTYWKREWGQLPDHLKARVRDGIYKKWGSFLTIEIIKDLFLFEPTLELPGLLVTAISKTPRLKQLQPIHPLFFDGLSLTYAGSASDVAIAGMVYQMPRITALNLRGCTLAGKKTIETILRRCSALKRIDLSYTNIKGLDVAELLERFGSQLESFEMLGYDFKNYDSCFASLPFPRLTKLSLPGDMLNTYSSYDKRKSMGRPQQVNVKPTPDRSPLKWSTLSDSFPSLTDLFLNDLVISPGDPVRVKPNSLTHLVLEFRAAPVPLTDLSDLIRSQQGSLREFSITDASEFTVQSADDFLDLQMALSGCELMEDFTYVANWTSHQLVGYRTYMSLMLNGVYGCMAWRRSVKRLDINCHMAIEPFALLDGGQEESSPALETLSLVDAFFKDSAAIARSICQFRRLRHLDLSKTAITEEDIFRILDYCPLLDTVDLSGCRGIGVVNRRNIFKAWEKSRKIV